MDYCSSRARDESNRTDVAESAIRMSAAAYPKIDMSVTLREGRMTPIELARLMGIGL